jgi:DNA-binding winged helix-turn-helix (wHTH) protein
MLPESIPVNGAVTLGEPVHSTFAFGDFRLDALGRRLIRGSNVVPLPERLFGVLWLLVRSNGTVVEKETFAAVVWPDVVMTDANLAQHIYLLRQLLKETARDRSYIMAAAGRGYRFTVPVFVEPRARSGTAPEPLGYYARGSSLLEKRSAPALEQAVEAFEAALEIDPEYTPALGGLARAHALLAEYWSAQWSRLSEQP